MDVVLGHLDPSGIIALGLGCLILVVAHELGHAVAAVLCGMEVDRIEIFLVAAPGRTSAPGRRGCPGRGTW